jgi:hypothetical protein
LTPACRPRAGPRGSIGRTRPRSELSLRRSAEERADLLHGAVARAQPADIRRGQAGHDSGEVEPRRVRVPGEVVGRYRPEVGAGAGVDAVQRRVAKKLNSGSPPSLSISPPSPAGDALMRDAVIDAGSNANGRTAPSVLNHVEITSAAAPRVLVRIRGRSI